MRRLLLTCFAFAALLSPMTAVAQEDVGVDEVGDSVLVRLVDVDLRRAVQALGRYLDRPIVFGSIGDHLRVTIETPGRISRESVRGLLQAVLASHQLELLSDDEVYRIDLAQPQFDQQPPQEAGAPRLLFVLKLRHARALTVASTINALFGQAGALGELGAPRATLAGSLEADLVPPVGEDPGATPAISRQVAELSGEITVIADQASNSLLVRATRRDFDLIEAAVQQLDVRPLQVLIEVVIAEVRSDRSSGIAMETILPEGDIGSATMAGAIGVPTLGDLILRIIEYGGADLTSTLTLAASRGDARILSRPIILAANNETAEILVGSQRPFVQVQRALPTEAPVRDQVVQFKDVGTRLSVTPTISDDGYVMLEVTQEVNQATAEVAFDAPVISTRTIQTQLLVRDRHTAVLGGLRDTQTEYTREGVPLLSDIPVLGGLFGSQVRRSSETELFVFLTPKVIRTDEDLAGESGAVGDKTKELIGNGN